MNLFAQPIYKQYEPNIRQKGNGKQQDNLLENIINKSCEPELLRIHANTIYERVIYQLYTYASRGQCTHIAMFLILWFIMVHKKNGRPDMETTTNKEQ